MVKEANFHQETWQKLRRASSIEEVVKTLEDVLVLAEVNALSNEEYELISIAFRALQDFTFDDPAKGRELILEYLLPTLDRLAKGEQNTATYRCRTCLVDWINQYLDPVRMTLRDEVLDNLLDRLNSAAAESACWTISAIGYRRGDIVDTLWLVAERQEDEVGDVALSVLTSLGIPFDQRPRLLEGLHDRASKRGTVPLISALRRLADPSSIEVVRTYWLEPEKIELSKFDRFVALRILLDIADAQDSDPRLQDHVWQIVSGLSKSYPDIFNPQINSGRKVAPRCDSLYVVPDLLARLQLSEGGSGGSTHRRHLLYRRLEECIRPHQLRGWKSVELSSVVEIVRQDALQDTELKVLALTEKAMLKENAWKSLLRLGYAPALDWYEDAVVSETNPSVSAEISDLLACFSLSPLPSSVIQWVTAPYNYTAEPKDYPGELTVRTSAIQVARSAASSEAFSALLNFGLTIDALVLQESTLAIFEVARYLVHSGKTEVVDKLAETVLYNQKVEQRIAAVGALELLAAASMLSGEQASKLVPLLSNEQRDLYERSTLVAILGYLPAQVLTSDAYESLKEWALKRDDWLGSRSLETLARHGCLLSQPQLLSKRLGLQQIGNQWDLSAEADRGEWAEFIIGLLYSHHPERFTPAIVSLLQTQDWTAGTEITNWLDNFHQKSDLALHKNIEEALITRTRTRQSRSLADTDLINVLSRLTPNRLANERWQEIWPNWLPSARVALADSLGKANYTISDSRKNATSLLILLTRDGQYAVRRAAYRGLSRLSPNSLLSLCKALAKAPEVELRQRAAEATGWLKDEESSSDIFTQPFDPSTSSGHRKLRAPLQQQLATDPEPTVRETAHRIRLERRERLWAEQYLLYIRQVEGKSNEEVLSCWRYGEALTQIGDDSTIEALRSDLATRSWPPNVRHWVRQIIKGIEKRWRKVKQDWPEPWVTWEGAIEEGQGLVLHNGHKSKVRYSIWLKTAATPSQSRSWGGMIWQTESPRLQLINVGKFMIQLEDGRRGEALASVSDLFAEEVMLIGNGKYPS